ncbi:MAG TPA: hypothetical protein HA362_00975 [Nanoarchaeota archaeon]|nr:hypothetical protein [Nanoarchaeota archaeon]
MEVPKDAIWLRPHHVHRLFFDWQGWDFASYLRCQKDDGARRYDEGTLKHIRTIYERLFLHNAPFVITPSVDDICRGCGSLKNKEFGCITPDVEPNNGAADSEFNRAQDGKSYYGISRNGFSKLFGISFNSSVDTCFDNASCVRYVPLAVYKPSDLVRNGIKGLKELIADERCLPDFLKIDGTIINCEFKLMALEKAYERLYGRLNKTTGVKQK